MSLLAAAPHGVRKEHSQRGREVSHSSVTGEPHHTHRPGCRKSHQLMPKKLPSGHGSSNHRYPSIGQFLRDPPATVSVSPLPLPLPVDHAETAEFGAAGSSVARFLGGWERGRAEEAGAAVRGRAGWGRGGGASGGAGAVTLAQHAQRPCTATINTRYSSPHCYCTPAVPSCCTPLVLDVTERRGRRNPLSA